MIHALIRWSLANRLSIVILALVVMAAGTFVTLRMPVDVFPDLTAPTVTVLVEGPGLTPEELERQVTFPIETAMNGAADVRRVRSGTAVGIAVIWIEFDWGADVHRARQTVTERLAAIADGLPAGIETPKLAPISSIMGEILFVALTSERHDAIELRTVAATEVRRRLLAVAGVSQVTPTGGETKQYQVVLSPDLLRGYGLSAEHVLAAVERTNESVAAGVVTAGSGEVLVEAVGRVHSLEDVAATLVEVRNGVPIRVGDLGVVEIGAPLPRGVGSAAWRTPDGTPVVREAVVLAIQKQPGANTLELTKRLEETFDQIRRGLPAGMEIHQDLFRQATFIQTSIANTATALLEGAAMVVLVVVVFLASLRASFVTLVALPLSLLASVLALQWFGANFNTMTLGGMAIAIGALVDDAIIDVENVVRRLREERRRTEGERRPSLQVILAASLEVRGSIVLATCIILLVFLPLFFLSGVEGRLLRPLGFAFTVSLAASLLTALTLTPALCSFLLPSSKTVAAAREPLFVRFLQARYQRVLDWALRHPGLVTAPSVGLFGLAVAAGLSLGRGFLPEFNEGALVVGVVTVPGTSLAESSALGRLAEEALMKHPEIVAIGRRTGRAEEDEHVQGVEASEIDLTLDMDAPLRRGLPKRTKAELLDALRHELAGIPGIQATFGQPIGHRIDHMLSGTRANVAVKIFGDDLARLRELATGVERVMRDVPGVVDLATEQQALVPTTRIEFDRDAIARHGITVADVASALEFATLGRVAGEVLEGWNPVDLVVRVGHAAALTPEALARILVDGPGGSGDTGGRKLPLSALASLREDRAPNFISRENVQRKIVVTCNVAERDLRSVVEDVRARVATAIELPRGYHVEYGGQFESAAATGERLVWLGGLIVAGIAGLLYFMFRSLRDVVFILLNLPLALIGGVAGVLVGGGTLSVASLIGFITVFGIAARNGIMMVSHVRHLEREEGVRDFREAVRRGASERLAPILMTALAAGLALIPLALRGDAPGNEILTPMAIVILFGLLSSTFLNMVLVPALFLRFGRPAAQDENASSSEVQHASA